MRREFFQSLCAFFFLFDFLVVLLTLSRHFDSLSVRFAHCCACASLISPLIDLNRSHLELSLSSTPPLIPRFYRNQAKSEGNCCCCFGYCSFVEKSIKKNTKTWCAFSLTPSDSFPFNFSDFFLQFFFHRWLIDRVRFWFISNFSIVVGSAFRKYC